MSSQYISKMPKDVVIFEDYELRHQENCPAFKWGMFFCPRLRMVFLTGEWSDFKDRIQAIRVDDIDNCYVVSGTNNFQNAKMELRKWINKQANVFHLVRKAFPLKHKLNHKNQPVLTG